MDRKSTIIISVAIILGFSILGFMLRGSIEKIGNSQLLEKSIHETNRYQMISANESNIIIFDTVTGEYWRKYISINEGPTEWKKEESPNLK